MRENVSHLRTMWLDIDVGSRGYDLQDDTVTAVAEFVHSTGVPAPSLIVSSGRGVHVYWVFTADVPVTVWERIAPLFKRVCVAHGLRADPARTADPCSVLRPIGTTHRKAVPLPVHAAEYRGGCGLHDLCISGCCRGEGEGCDGADPTNPARCGERRPYYSARVSADIGGTDRQELCPD